MAAFALGAHCRGLIEINKTDLQFSYLGSRELEGKGVGGQGTTGCSETLEPSEPQLGSCSFLSYPRLLLT
jgi:hypothetical protein